MKYFGINVHIIYYNCSEMNENYNAHGAKVVEYYQNSDQGLVALERLWREHFVNVMQPKHLPDLWSLEHNVQR